MNDDDSGEHAPATPLEFSKLNIALGLKESTGPANQAVPSQELLQELAEDMLDVIRRLGTVDQQFQELHRAVDGLSRGLESSSQQSVRAIDNLRRDLAEEGRGVAVRRVFDAVVGAIDSLEAIRTGLNPTTEANASRQLWAATCSLDNVLQALGFSKFEVTSGDPFDPSRMQCFGFTPGESGKVLGVVMPGYSAGAVVVRPAQVLLADPNAHGSDTTGESDQ